MVLFLNLLLGLVFVGYLTITYFILNSKVLSNESKIKRSVVTFIVTVILGGIYQIIMPSYLPKGVVERTPVIEFEPKDLVIKDVQSKPMSSEERDQRRKEAYLEDLPFKQKESLTDKQ